MGRNLDLTNKIEEAIDKLRLPRGFASWAWATGRAKEILDGKKDIVQALREFEREREVRYYNE